MRRRTFLRTVGAGAVPLAAGCGGSDGGGEGLPDTVTVGYPSPALPVYNFALFPALETRLAEQDVTLKLQEFSGYTPMAGALIQGDIDIGMLSLTSILKARAQNLPIVAPVGYTQEYDFALIGGAGIEEWSDLRGGTVAVHSQSSMSTVTGRLMAAEELGDAEACNWEYVIGTPSRLAAVKAGRADAAVVFVSGALQAETDGYATTLSRPWEYDRLSDQTAAALVTVESAVEERTELVETLVDETLASYEYLYDADAGDVVDDALATGKYADFDRAVWVDAFEEVREAGIWPREGGLGESNVSTAQDVLQSTGLITEDQRLPREQFVTDRFL